MPPRFYLINSAHAFAFIIPQRQLSIVGIVCEVYLIKWPSTVVQEWGTNYPAFHIGCGVQFLKIAFKSYCPREFFGLFSLESAPFGLPMIWAVHTC